MSVIESTSRIGRYFPSTALMAGGVHDERNGSARPPRRESAAPSLALLELVTQGVVVLDADGRVVSCNDRFTTLIDFPSIVVLDATLDDYLPARDAAAFRALQLDDRDERCGEFTLRRLDGSVVPVRISVVTLSARGDASRTCGAVFTDLRDERDAQRRLAAQADLVSHEIRRRRTAEERFGRVLRSVAAASWECDLATGRATHAIGMDRVFGAATSPVWSLHALLDAFVPADRDAVERAFALARVSGSIAIEGRVLTADGTDRWARLEGRRLSDAPTTLALFASDVTSTREAADRLHRAADLEAVGRMAAGIAHDLNNFLHVIGNSLEMLARRTAGDAQIARLSGTAQHALAHASRLSRQLLGFSRGEALQRQCLSVYRLMPSVRQLLDRVLPESVDLRIACAEPAWPCTTDLDQLEAALLNLAINARDAMPDGGVLAIDIANRRVDAACAASWAVVEGDYVLFRVSDTGTGMPPEIAARAFEPFFTTKAHGKGTGLGLSQVYAFAKRSRGFVTIESAAGAGSEVLLFLPRDD